MRKATRRLFGTVTRMMVVVSLLALGMAGLGTGGSSLAFAAEGDSNPVAGITKTNDLDGASLKPGDAFKYDIVATCSGTTDECVNFTIKDTLPEGLVVDMASLPKSTDTRTVSYNQQTRELVITMRQPLDSPQGALGLKTGTPITFEIGVSLPADSQITDGSTISNTATATGDNFAKAESTNDIPVTVPKVVTPVATKAWKDGSAVAGSQEASTLALGVRNGSSSSAKIDSLTVTDESAETFDRFTFTSATVAAFPKGADTATLRVKTSTGWVEGATITAAGALALPAGVTAADVVGVEVKFTNAAGELLPYDATGGSVDVGLVLRDNYRGSGLPLKPAGKEVVANCAAPSAHEAVLGDTAGKSACANYTILPDTLVLTGSKAFFADTNGNFKQDAGEYAVLGQNSPVSATVDVKNGSPFPVKTITITEPAAGSELEKVDLSIIRLRPPAGATKVSLTLTKNGVQETASYTIAELAALGNKLDGVGVTKVVATYTGEDADGNATIAEGATAGLDIHGTLNAKVTEADLPNGSSPGIANCAGYAGDAGRDDGSGTATGEACKTMSIEESRHDGVGQKTVGQTSVPPGQPIPFTLTLKNNGNKPMITPVMADPPLGADGTPDPSRPNPFDTLAIRGATVTPTAGVTLAIYSGGAWIPLAGATATQLDAAKGIKASLAGNLATTQQLVLNLVTERRLGTNNDVDILNCFSTTAGGDFTTGDPACAPSITTGDENASASLNKNISPATLPEFIPGMQRQHAIVDLTIFNTGNLSAQNLQVQDTDEDFFEAVDFVKFTAVTMPAGANRIQIDALTASGWTNGTPATAATLPAGVAATAVLGFRATFTNSSGGYTITPCAAADCRGAIKLDVSPRETLRSEPATPVRGKLENTATGSFLTHINTDPKPIGDVHSNLELVPGDARLDADKSQDTSLAPGETAPFYLKVTNNGTANLPNLVVKDLLPAGMAFDETFKGDNGLPFKVTNVQVPAGTPVLPAPAFSTVIDGERIGTLVWDFGKDFVLAPGSTFTIEIRAGLAAGVKAGELVTNTMGATSSHPKLQCTNKSTTDGDFGQGKYCTDTATVKVNTGAAFQARKWVAGTPELGWYNTLTKQTVAVGGATCPVTTDADGVKYTAYPCITMVNPGDTFQYLLRVVNAGTESGTDMRIIDRLPASGDKTVVGNLDRGTAWDKAPTLASVPQLTGAGATMQTLYSTKNTLCTDDLKMGGAGSSAAQCPSAEWNAGYGPTVTGLQFRIAFDPKLAPGKGVEISFAMKSPLDVTQKGDPTIAWNSFGHAETTDKGGKPHVLPPTEPIQVGVALAYGELVLVKKIGANPSNLPVADAPFTFHVTCQLTPVGGKLTTVLDKDYKVTSRAEVRITGIPAGATCKVWEADTLGGFTDHGTDKPLTYVIKPALGVPSVETAEITNDFPDAVVELEKKVTGAGAGFAQGSYPMDVFCTFDGTPVEGYNPKKIQVPANDKRFVTAVPPGSSCYVAETDDGGATEVSYLPAMAGQPGESGSVVTHAGVPAQVTVTNDFRTGSLSVNKEVTGAGAPELAQGPFTFSVVCEFNGKAAVVDESITIPKGATGQSAFTSEKLEGLPAGASCVVSETDNGGADDTPAPVTVVVPDSDNVVAGFTGEHANVYSAGTIDVTKTLAGDAADEDYAKNAVFTILVTCERDAKDAEGNPVRTTVFSQSVDIKGGESSGALLGADGKAVKLPLGTSCYGVETKTGGATAGSVNHDSFENGAKVVPSEVPTDLQQLTITATNTFSYGELTLSKKLDGAAAGYVGGREFTLALSCELEQGGATATPIIADKPFTLKGGETVAVDKLPVGANCWVAETDNGGASTVAIDHGDRANAAVVGQDRAVALTVTNTFDAGLLTVSKKVVNGGAGPYTFTLVCTTGQGAVALAPGDAAFTLKGGAAKTISVPNGAACVVAESNVPDGDTVTYLASSGAKDGNVRVNGTATLQVTNTFKVAPVTPLTLATPLDPGTGPELGNTGAAGIGGLTLAALGALLAGMVLVVRRRKAAQG